MAKRSRKKRRGVESPTSSCILLCDDVLISRGKGKHFLQGIIGTIVVAQLPAVIGGYVAYVRLSNVYGGQKVTLSFEKASTGETLIETSQEFPSQSDPLGVYTLVVPVPAFPVDEAGRYLFIASHDGVPFAQTPLEIRVVQTRAEP